MTRSISEAEYAFDLWHKTWKEERALKQAATRAAVLAALQDGKTVVERGFGPDLAWPEGRYGFRDRNSPEALTEHLMKRHIGFGTYLLVDGEEV
jgi:hypothetical protein